MSEPCDTCKLVKETCPVYEPPPNNVLAPFAFKLAFCPDRVSNGEKQKCKEHDWVTIDGITQCFDCGIELSDVL